MEKPIYELTCEEIRQTMGENNGLYFDLLNNYILCEISKSEFVEELNKLSQKYSNIIQLNNKLLESLITKNNSTSYNVISAPPVDDFDQQDDEEYMF